MNLKCPFCGSELETLPCSSPETAKRLGHIVHLRCPRGCPTAYVVMDEDALLRNYKLKEVKRNE